MAQGRPRAELAVFPNTKGIVILTSYNLTPEHFARARADIDRRRAQLDAELAQLDTDESAAAAIAKRYPEALVEEQAEGISPSPPTTRRKTKRSNTKRPNTGRPYKPNENERIVAAERGTLEALAVALGRDYPGVQKQHEVLLKQQREPEKTDTSAPDRELEIDSCARSSTVPCPGGDREDVKILPGGYAEARQDYDAAAARVFAEPSATESRDGGSIPPGAPATPIVEPAAAPETVRPPDLAAAMNSVSLRELAEADGRRARQPPAKPGVSVTGRLMDNGPEDRRVYEGGFASRSGD
jgi:hypothetical protein